MIGNVSPGPLNHDKEAVAKADEKEQVKEQPTQATR